MKRYMAHILVSAEKIIEHFLKVQVHDEGTLADGGMEGLVVDVKPTVFALRAAMSVYLYPQSRFYKDETLRTAMEQAIDFVARNQNEDGSFDYTVCNFHSAPDTAFCYHPMDKTYRLMKKFENDVDTYSLQEKYLSIMKKAAAAIRDGGFHTPNHRWAICAALMQAADVFAQMNHLLRVAKHARKSILMKELMEMQTESMQSALQEAITALSTMQ